MRERRSRGHKRAQEQPIGCGKVSGMDHDGRGVIRQDDGKVVFVDGCLPGETVAFRIRRRRRSFDEASLVEVIKPVPDRQQPPCAHADLCGGCKLQHQSIASQRAYKEARLLEDLERIGRVRPAATLPMLLGPELGYRRKARLGVKYVAGKGGALVGFREKHAPYIADIERCEAIVPPFGQLVRPLRNLISGLSIRDRIPQLEIAVGLENAMVVRHLEPLAAADREQLSDFAREHGVRIFLQSAGPDTVVPLDPGQATYLHYELPGLGRNGTPLRIRFAPTDFVQVNSAINEQLVPLAIELLEVDSTTAVLDAFCGLGNFSLGLALVAGTVLGVEGERQLVDGARHNARFNGIRNARFEVGDLFQPAVAGPLAAKGFDRMLLDPPRSGAEQLVRALDTAGPARIVYVSCNSSTLARDAGILVDEKGYRLSKVGLVDMFPYTAHAEAIACFER